MNITRVIHSATDVLVRRKYVLQTTLYNKLPTNTLDNIGHKSNVCEILTY